MPKIKVPRKSVSVDMTAMTDVAFLLLTFFILTAKFRPSETILIDTPTSRAEKPGPEDRMTISVDSAGKAYISFSIPKRRAEVLENMTAQYGTKYPQLLTLNDKQKRTFTAVELYGFPNAQLPDLLNKTTDQIGKIDKMPGIPLDSTDNQLGDWVNAARYSAADEEKDLEIAIKGDKTTNIKAVQRVIEILREREVYRFNLLTTLEGKVD